MNMCLAQVSEDTRPGPWEQLQWKTNQTTNRSISTSVLFMKTSFSTDTCCQYSFMSGERIHSLDVVVFVFKHTVYMYQNCMKYLRNIYIFLSLVLYTLKT